MSTRVEKNQDISSIPNGEFVFCKELGKGFIKRDISSLGVTQFEAVCDAIEALDLGVLQTLGLDSVIFLDGNIAISDRLQKSVIAELDGLNGSLMSSFIDNKKSVRKYFDVSNNEQINAMIGISKKHVIDSYDTPITINGGIKELPVTDVDIDYLKVVFSFGNNITFPSSTGGTANCTLMSPRGSANTYHDGFYYYRGNNSSLSDDGIFLSVEAVGIAGALTNVPYNELYTIEIVVFENETYILENGVITGNSTGALDFKAMDYVFSTNSSARYINGISVQYVESGILTN